MIISVGINTFMSVLVIGIISCSLGCLKGKSTGCILMVNSYGVVPKGFLTFLGGLYKEVAKTIPGTLVCRFTRQNASKKYFFLPKTLRPQLRM